MRQFFVKCVFALVFGFVAVAQAADNFTVWDDQTFTGPFSGGVIATSATFNTTAGNNAIKVHIDYSEVNHGGSVPNVCPCKINMVVEEQLSAGVWVPAASQHSQYYILDSGKQRMVILSPALNIDGDSDTIVTLPDGSDMRVSRTQGAAPDSFRVRITATEDVPGIIQSIRVNAYGRQYVE